MRKSFMIGQGFFVTHASLPSERPLVPTSLEDARIISGSQADAFNTCLRKWMFSYAFKRQAKTPSRSLSLGIVVHELLAEFYQKIKEGYSAKNSELAAMQVLTQKFERGEYTVDILSKAHILVSRYIAQDTIYQSTNILEVETDFFLPINTEYWYGMRLDLLVEAKIGRMKGNVLLIDHKTTYDFYTPASLQLNPQMPKYVAPVRYAGYPVHEAYINQIRTRFDQDKIPGKSDDDLFKRAPVGITQSRVKNALKHHMVTSERILNMSKLPLQVLEDECTPVQNQMICRNCPFKEPCIEMEEGKTAQQALGEDYEQKQSGFAIENKADEDG
jgi:hypothetical protein